MQENCWMNRAGKRDLGRGKKRQMKLEVDFKKEKKKKDFKNQFIWNWED